MFKKILSPILYAGFLALTIIVVFGTTYILTHTLVRPVLVWELIIITVTLCTAGTICYWCGNVAMQRLEQVRKPTRRDHFRQSGICYVIILLLIVSIFFLLPQVYGADGVAYTPDLYYVNAMILGGITLWAIFVNALFLYIRRKI